MWQPSVNWAYKTEVSSSRSLVLNLCTPRFYWKLLKHSISVGEEKDTRMNYEKRVMGDGPLQMTTALTAYEGRANKENKLLNSVAGIPGTCRDMSVYLADSY